MTTARRLVLTLGWLCLCGETLPAQTSYPMITHVTPVAVQRGQSAEVTVEGQMNFFGCYKVLFEGAGLTAEVVGDPPAKVEPAKRPQVKSVKLKLSVAPDAVLGVREFRLASVLGVSSVGQILIVDAPVVVETGDNNTAARANPVSLPAAICGRVEAAEDVDYFKFKGEAGKTVTFEVFCARIQDKIHDLQKHADPILTVYDADGRELASNDDAYFADPLLSFTLPKTGDYVLQVRDSKYDGDPRWVYAVTATDRPYASHVFPLAVNPGQAVEVEVVGSAKAVRPRVPLTAPTRVGVHELQLDLGETKTNPVALIVTPLPLLTETEPNDEVSQATRLTLPCGVNGRIGKKRGLDHFVFTAKKGQGLRFEVKARRFGTPLCSGLDAFLEIMNDKGQVLASNDDTNGKDAALAFTPPADGDYVLCLRDLHSKGGDTWVYFLECDLAKPDFTLRCDPDKTMIGPGSSMPWYVQVARTGGFDRPVKVEVKGLPKGVTVNPLTIPPTMTQGLLVLTADDGAPVDAANVELVGTATVKGADGKEETLVRGVTANQEIYFPGGGRGKFDVNQQTVAVTEPSDILAVEVSTREVKLKPGEEVKIEVTIKRRPDYDKAVSLDVLMQHLGSVFGNPLPPGVTVDEAKSKTLLGTESKGHVVLKAAADAKPIDDVPVSVLCNVSINFVVKVSYSSSPISVSVVK